MNLNNPDYELITSFLNGNESSFNRLAKKYQEKIYWHARRMTGNHLDADEVLQEVLIVMYNKLNTFKFESSVYSWIYRITATRSLNFIKRRKLKSLFSLQSIENSKQSGESVIKDLEDKQKVEELEKKLQRIPTKQREVFVMRNFEELSYDEIAEITGKSVGALKANYFHAVKKLKEMVKND